MKKTDKWVNNFSGVNIGYQLCCPWSGFGLHYSQKVFFGRQIFTEHFAFMHGLDLTGGYLWRSELRIVIEATLAKIFDESTFVEKNHKEAYKWNKEFLNYGKDLLKLNLEKISDKQFTRILEKFIILQEKAHAHAVMTTWFVDSDGQDLSNRLIEITDKYVVASKAKVKTSEAFSLLTTPSGLSILNNEEIESLGVLQAILADKKSAAIIRNLSIFKDMPTGLTKSVEKRMLAHFKKWQWSPFGYLGPAYKIGDYLKLWHDQIGAGLNVKKELQSKIERPKRIKKEKDVLKKLLRISVKDSRIFDIGADIVFLKNYRKDCSFHGFFVFDQIIGEIGRRFFLSKNQMNALSYLEMIAMLQSGKAMDTSRINSRLKSDVVLIHENASIKIIEDKKAASFLKKQDKYIEKDIVDPDAKEFKGTCACSGYAKGIVKIVNVPKEMKKMNQGDIMVAHTTFPSLVPAMKLAGAIITEDGGITCHAAIVSRELGTPCVTGIKIITKAVKDGDMVEVDANKGIVKIIKKA